MISRESGQALADQHNMTFFETSAKDKTNLNLVFETMASTRLAISRQEDRFRNNPSSTPVVAPAPVQTNPLEEVVDNGFANFNLQDFLRENLERSMTTCLDTFERMIQENKKLQSQVSRLKDVCKTVREELNEHKKQENDPLPADVLVLREEFLKIRDENNQLQQSVSRLQAAPQILSSFTQLEDFETLKSELRESLEKVEFSQYQYKQKQSNLCVVCYVKEKNMVLTGCAHMCLCEECANLPSLTKCPVCNQDVQGKLKVYI